MNLKNSLIRLSGGLLLCFILAGCQTTVPQADTRPRFYESASTDLILRFNNWETIHQLRPEFREGGSFLPILTLADIERQLGTQPVRRRLAVVVLGFLFPPDMEARYAREWDALLSARGFQRVVVLRTGAGKTIDGLLLVHDSSIGGAHDQVAAARPAAFSPPVGANAANPSVH
jgi:hypothetical protein